MNLRMLRNIFTAILLSLFLTGAAWGAMGEITAFSFSAAQEDVLGMDEAEAVDGKPDAHFVVSIKGIGAITDISLKAVDGVRAWDITSGNDKWNMAVKDATGKIITAGSGMSIVPFLGAATLNLYVSDDGTAFSETREFEVSVKFIDGSNATAKTEVKGMPDIFKAADAIQSQQTQPLQGDMKAFLYGIRSRDIAGKSETLGADGSDDAHFRVIFSTISVVDQVTIRNVDGTNAMWDTVPGNGISAVAVLLDGNLKNRADGSVKFAVEGDTALDLWVADNGAVAGGRTRFEIIVRFNDGSTLREIAATDTSNVQSEGEGFISAFLSPPNTTDIAGRGETPGKDGNPDWKVSLKVSGQETIISLIVRGIDGAPGEWDTLPGNNKPIAVVTDAAGTVLNSSTGKISIPLNGTKDLALWLADDGSLAKTSNKYRVIAVLSDGSTLERVMERGTLQPSQQVQQQSAATSGPVQESDSVRAFYMGKGPRNLVGKGEPADIRNGLDTNLDAHIRLRLLSLEGTIRSIALESLDRKGGDWDTIPGNGIWHIVVTETDTGQVISKTDGSLTKAVSGNSQLHLWLADNGKLSANPSGYRVIVRFADGRALAQTLF
ncbi:MAG: hypothetical protein STSR0007_08450 [Thermovirga sp.]